MGLWTRVRLPPNPSIIHELETNRLSSWIFYYRKVWFMADKDNLQIQGYRFGSREDVEIAGEEMRKVAYFKERIKGKSPRMILSLYDKLLDEKIFKTPIGWEYLRELQEQLKETGIPED